MASSEKCPETDPSNQHRTKNLMAAQSASPMNVATFVEVLRRSQLIEATKLTRILKTVAAATDDSRNAAAVAELLITAGHITRWQASQLLKGKYRGFLMGKYCFRRPLGRGGMGAVFEAEHTVLGTRVAIKVLPIDRNDAENSVSRFVAEARAAAKLNHPNLLRVHDCDVFEGRRFMVMDLVEGSNLGELVERNGPLSYRNAIDLLRQAAAGLEFAHENGVVHRDVKPHNFMVDKKGQLKVADLGLALFQVDSPDRHTQDGNSSILGTVDYVAPEQAWDSRKVDRRADIYSLGCTLYFMLTGRPPFATGTLAQRLAKHQTAQAVPLQQIRKDCPAPIAQMCARMMAKKPAERFQRMREIVTICDALLNKLGGPSSELAALASRTGPRPNSGADSNWGSNEFGMPIEQDYDSFAGSNAEYGASGYAQSQALSSPANDFFSAALPPAQIHSQLDSSFWQQAATAKAATAKPTKKQLQASAEANRNRILLIVGLAIATLSVGISIVKFVYQEEPETPNLQSQIKFHEGDGPPPVIINLGK